MWLVLSVVGFYANRHFALKQAEVLIQAAREDRKRERSPVRPQLPAADDEEEQEEESDADWIRRQQGRPLQKKAATPAPAPAATDGDRRFIHCPECDAKNNANRETCWQCKNSLRPGDNYEAVNSSDLLPSRGAKLRKMAAMAGPVCKRCGAINDDDAERCTACGRALDNT